MTYGKATNEARIHQRKLEEHDTLGGVMVREQGPAKSLILVHAGVCIGYVHILRKQPNVDVQLERMLYKLHIVGVSGRADGEDGEFGNIG